LLNQKELSSLIKINEDTSDSIRRRSVVSKLVECTSKKRAGTELFIVEGDSAMGPYLYVRDKETQAVLPIRGKILNTTYKDLKEVIKNKEICDIANSIGCGIGPQCDASKSRYDKVIISADADPDGLQINCLVLAVFVNLFPDMIKQGRVYVSLPPLWCWGTSAKDYGWCDSVDQIPAGAKNVTHFKGLGEMNTDQLEYFLVDKNTRHVMQIEYPSDIDEFNKILGTSEGKGELLRGLGLIMSE
jgi:DNA gyrase subunit B